MSTHLTTDQLHSRLGDILIIDVRSPGEFVGGHIPGARNIPLDRLHQAIPTLRDAAGRGDIAVVCASGNRSRSACERLAAAGIPAAGLAGGTSAWASAGHPRTGRKGYGRPGRWTVRFVWPPDRSS